MIILTLQPCNNSYSSLQGRELNKIKITKYPAYAKINTAILTIASFYNQL